jgi:hypothetical protein
MIVALGVLLGLTMRLLVGTDSLRGTARAFWDFGRTPQTAPVLAGLVSCTAPLSPAAALHYRLPRGIGFPSADSIVLGAPLPPGGPALTRDSANWRRIVARLVATHGQPTSPQKRLPNRAMSGLIAWNTRLISIAGSGTGGDRPVHMLMYVPRLL